MSARVHTVSMPIRLRSTAHLDSRSGEPCGKLMREAADYIDKLEGDNERLRHTDITARGRLAEYRENPDEWYCPSVDVCGWCGDSECDGIGCIASLDPDDPDDLEAIERLHSILRSGRLFIQANEALARAENRS